MNTSKSSPTGFLGRYVFQITGALVAVIYLVSSILNSTNSTAAIGFIFVPVAALIGALIGGALKYVLDVLRKKRSHSIPTTVLILVAIAFFVLKFIQTRNHDQDLRLAENPATSSAELLSLLGKNDTRITQAVASNPSLSVAELERLIDQHLTDYYIMSAAVQSPSLSSAEMDRIAALERSDFNGDAEYEVYQAQVWARLARRKDISEAVIHKLASKKNPEHFLILALLESPYTSCEEKKRFLPQDNRVLENAILRSMDAQKCTE